MEVVINEGKCVEYILISKEKMLLGSHFGKGYWLGFIDDTENEVVGSQRSKCLKPSLKR